MGSIAFGDTRCNSCSIPPSALSALSKAADAARAEKFLKECVTACEKVMASGYEIGDDYQATYNSTSLSGSNNIIFFKEYQNNLMYHSLIAYTCSSTQINGMTKDAFDAYLFKLSFTPTS